MPRVLAGRTHTFWGERGVHETEHSGPYLWKDVCWVDKMMLAFSFGCVAKLPSLFIEQFKGVESRGLKLHLCILLLLLLLSNVLYLLVFFGWLFYVLLCGHFWLCWIVLQSKVIAFVGP